MIPRSGAAGLHGATACWDQVYAQPRRRVDPVEQHVHSLLEVLPVTAAFLLTALHWNQARALTGRGRPDRGHDLAGARSASIEASGSQAAGENQVNSRRGAR